MNLDKASMSAIVGLALRSRDDYQQLCQRDTEYTELPREKIWRNKLWARNKWREDKRYIFKYQKESDKDAENERNLGKKIT